METYGEDGFMVGQMGAAYVHGMQHGDVGAPKSNILLMASSPKHFADCESHFV